MQRNRASAEFWQIGKSAAPMPPMFPGHCVYITATIFLSGSTDKFSRIPLNKRDCIAHETTVPVYSKTLPIWFSRAHSTSSRCSHLSLALLPQSWCTHWPLIVAGTTPMSDLRGRHLPMAGARCWLMGGYLKNTPSAVSPARASIAGLRPTSRSCRRWPTPEIRSRIGLQELHCPCGACGSHAGAAQPDRSLEDLVVVIGTVTSETSWIGVPSASSQRLGIFRNVNIKRQR